MEDSPYSECEPEQLILRDHLAIDRTVLANERTLLAYLRTALAILVVGASLIKFFHAEVYEIIGWALLPLGVGVIVFGAVRFRRTAACIRAAGTVHLKREESD
jgi:putative membrane protein